MQITEHFTLEEFERSDLAKGKGINNALPNRLFEAACFTLAGMERIRAVLRQPIKITSGYRCAELNAEVRGVMDSQHTKAQACDFVCPTYGTPGDVFARLSGYVKMLGIDQVILEGTWVHVSFTLNPRYEVLTKTGHGYKGIPSIQ